MPNPLGNLNQKLQWVTRGENCPICDSLRGRIYTYDMWMSAGVWPGFHLNCDCDLRKVDDDSPTSDPDFFGTDLNLMMETINPFYFLFKLHWDPNYLPFSWYMTDQIMNSHLTYGAGLPIGEVLKKMRNEFVGFFKRSTFFDNFFIWRTFRTVQHFQNIDDTYSGYLPPIIRKRPRKTPSPNLYFSSIHNLPAHINTTLKPKSLKPYYPKHSYYFQGGH